MSFNGSGLFNVNTSGQPVVAGTTITSAAFNALTADLATGLSTAICKDGQTTVTANIPLNSFKLTGLGAGTLTGDAARMSQLQSGASQLLTSLTGTDTLAATILPTLTAYATGNVFTFVAGNTNTTAVTLNIDALGAKAVTRDGSTALIAGDIVAGTTYSVMYDGTRFQLLNCATTTNPVISGSLTLSGGTANQVQYLNGSKVLTGSSNLTFDGTTLTANALTTTSTVTINGGTANGVAYLNGSKVLTTGSALTYDGSTFVVTKAATGSVATLIGPNATSGIKLGLNVVAGEVGSIKWDNSTTLTGVANGVGINANGGGIVLQNNGTTAITLANAGNVTINAPSSGNTLALAGTGTGILKLTDSSATGYSGITLAGTGTQNYAIGMGGPSEATFGVANKWYLYDGLAGAMRMVVDTSGNVGIGITSPTSKLHVSSTASTYAVDIASTNTSINNRTLNVYNSAATGTTALTNQIVRLASNGSGADCTLQFTDSVANNGYIGMKSGALNFGANTTTTQMTLDASGNLLVGTTDTGETTGVGLKLITTSSKPSFKVVTSGSTNTSGSFFAYSTGAAAYRFYVNDAGTIFATSTSITAISDQSLKTNVRDLETGLSQVMALKPRRFDWINGDAVDVAGFVAQEVEQVLPDLVCPFNYNDTEAKLGLKMGDMIPTLVKAMQEQQALIESLTARLNSLENK